jgi:hypothetical protein
MDKTLMDLEARKEKLEKEYHEAMNRYRSELVKLEHEIVERSKEVSRSGHGTEAPEDGWNAEHEGVVTIDKREGEHLFEREKVFDGGDQ